jgi:hypothetical protein
MVPQSSGLAIPRGFDEFNDPAHAYGMHSVMGMTRSSSRRSLRDVFDDDDGDRSESRRRRRSGSRTRSRSARKSMRRNTFDDDDDDDFETCRTRKSSRGIRKGSSHKHYDDDDEYDSDDPDDCSSDSESGYSRSNSKRTSKSKRTLKSQKRKQNRSKDESIRQARSILKDYKKSETLDEATCSRMDMEMTNLVAELKLQRQEMELKLKATQEEASKLKEECNNSNSRLMELEADHREKDKKLATAELEVVKKEKNEMAKMIKKLEEAKAEMEKKLSRATEETETLKQENQDTVSKVCEMEEEKEKLKAKLTTLEDSRDDIHRRLMEADLRSAQLKEEKKAKTIEIQQHKKAGATAMVESSERQRRTISKNIKRLEEERAQMRSMMAKMDLIEEQDDDMTVPLSDMGGQPMTYTPNGIQGTHYMDLAGNQVYEQPLRVVHSNMPIQIIDHSHMPLRGSSHGPKRPTQRTTSYHDPMVLRSEYSNRHLDISHAEAGSGSSNHNMILHCHNNFDGDVGIHGDSLTVAETSSSSEARPAGWLGEQIANRSFSNIMDEDLIDNRSRRSVRGAGHLGSSRHRSRSRDPSPETGAASNHIRSKRERARRCEQRLQDELRRSRSSNHTMSSVDCDGSQGSLNVEEFY